MFITVLQNLKKHCAKLVFFNSLKILLIFLFSSQAPTAFAAPVCSQGGQNSVCIEVSKPDPITGEFITFSAWLLVPCFRGSTSRCFEPFAGFTFVDIKANRNSPISPRISANLNTGKATFVLRVGPPVVDIRPLFPLEVGSYAIVARETVVNESPSVPVTVHPRTSETRISVPVTTFKYTDPIPFSSSVSGFGLTGKLSVIRKYPSRVGFPDSFETVFSNTYKGGVITENKEIVTGSPSPGVYLYFATFESSNINTLSSQSEIIPVTILPGDVVHTLATTTTEPVEFGQPISLISNVEHKFITPEGTVNFYDGDTFLGSETLFFQNGVRTSSGVSIKSLFTTSNINTLGNHNFRTEFIGSINFSSASANLNLTIVAAKSLTTLSSSGSPSFGGKPITLSAVVSGVEPTGTVSFFDGTKLLGSTQVLAGKASIITSEIKGIGDHAIKAVYNGDERNGTSTSPNITQTIKLNPAILTPILNIILN